MSFAEQDFHQRRMTKLNDGTWLPVDPWQRSDAYSCRDCRTCGSTRSGNWTSHTSRSTARLIVEYAIVTHPVLVGGGTPFFTALDNWVSLNLVETRTFP